MYRCHSSSWSQETSYIQSVCRDAAPVPVSSDIMDVVIVPSRLSPDKMAAGGGGVAGTPQAEILL